MKKYKTLLLEDNKEVINDILKYLQSYKEIVNVTHVAKTLSEAIDCLLEDTFDLSILDIDLPDGNCFELIEKTERTRFGEIVFCTRFAYEYLEKFIKASPIHYIPKPFSKLKVQEMVLTVEDCFSKKYNPGFLELNELNPSAKRVFINKNDIFYIEFIGNGEIDNVKLIDKVVYAFIDENKNNKKAIASGTLAEQFKRLPNKFVQCHRNFIINLDYLKIGEPLGETLMVDMPNMKKIPITRHYMDSVYLKKGIS